MEESSIGVTRQKGYVLDVACRASTGPFLSPERRFSILLLKDGAFEIGYREKTSFMSAPAIVLSGAEGGVSVTPQNGGSILSLAFHPRVINNRFEFDRLRDPADGMLTSDWQDRFYIEPFLARPGEGPRCSILNFDEARKAEQYWTGLERQLTAQPDDSWPCRSRSILIQALFLLVSLESDDAPPEDLRQGGSELVEKALRKIYLDYEKPLALVSLAKDLATNRTSLNEAFKRDVGTSFHRILTRRRLQVASRILTGTVLPISEIATRVGFGNTSRFHKLFKAEYGLTPAQWRREKATI
jgi:AraC-like DNA-binding protein